jgi:hypothetical protein
MTTWHDRLQTALDARKLDWPDLIKPTGKTKPSVYAWKPGANDRSTTMNADNAALVCDFLKINILWLFHGRGPSGLEPPDENGKKSQSTATGVSHSLSAAEPAPPEYHLTLAERTLLQGYRLAGDEGKDVLLQGAQGIIDRFAERREQKN